MRGRLIYLIRRGSGVCLQDAVGLVAVKPLDGVGERFRRRIAVAQDGARRLLLGVRACQQRNLGLLAGLEDRRKRLGQEVAVQRGAETESLDFADGFLDLLRGHGAQGGEAYPRPPQRRT